MLFRSFDVEEVEFGVWVYVPSGSPRVRVGANQYYQKPTSPWTYVFYDAAPPAYSTVWDQWEYVSTKFRFWQYGNAPSGYTLYPYPRPYVCPDGDFEVEAQFLMDDPRVAPVGRSGFSALPVSATGAEGFIPSVRTAEVSIELTGTLVDLNKQVEGSVSVDFDLSSFVAFSENVSGDLDVFDSIVIGQSARRDRKSTRLNSSH